MNAPIIPATPSTGPACNVPTVYQANYLTVVTLDELTGLNKDQLLIKWSVIDMEQRRLRHQYANACWCNSCEIAFQEAYRPGYQSCLNLETAYRVIIMGEWQRSQEALATAA